MKARVKETLDRLIPLMGLTEWKGKLKFHAKQPSEDEEVKYDDQTTLSVDADSKYLEFTINIYPKLFKRLKKHPDKLEDYLVHELSHVILSEYDDWLNELTSTHDEHHVSAVSERAAERFARAIMRALKEGR